MSVIKTEFEFNRFCLDDVLDVVKAKKKKQKKKDKKKKKDK